MPPWRMSAAAKAPMISAIPRTPLHPTTWSPTPGVFLPPHPTPWQEEYSHYIQRIVASDAARADDPRWCILDWQMKQRSARKDILDVHPYVDAAASSTVPPSSAVDTASPDRRLTPQGTQGVPPPPPPPEASSAAASFIDPQTSRWFFLCFIAVFTATLMQTVQLSDSAIAVFTATLRTCFCCYTQPLRFHKQKSFSRWESGLLEQIDAIAEELTGSPPQHADVAQRRTTWDRSQSSRDAAFRRDFRQGHALDLQAIHPLLMVAVFTARLRKRSEIVAVFTAKCWELLACSFHRQCTRVGFRRCLFQPMSRQSESIQPMSSPCPADGAMGQCRSILATLRRGAMGRNGVRAHSAGPMLAARLIQRAIPCGAIVAKKNSSIRRPISATGCGETKA